MRPNVTIAGPRRRTIDHFADRLIAACRAKGAPVCVGLDPVYERLPAAVCPQGFDRVPAEEQLASIERWANELLEVVRPYAACVKFQSACFERYHWQGQRLLDQLIERAAGTDLLVILDAKRGDIGISAEHYAVGCLADGPDALTVNSYLGADSLDPFVRVASDRGKGLFALVRTSNPGGDDLQTLGLAAGGTVADATARMVARVGEPYLGSMGYSLLGAVVGATKSADAARMRQLMPHQVFLVPGFGAQGGSADDVKACFKADGTGALITASRSVIYAHEKAGGDWRDAVRNAVADMNKQVGAILG